MRIVAGVVFGIVGLTLIGCGGKTSSGGGGGLGTNITAGPYGGQVDSRIAGMRLDLELTGAGSTASGFARLQTAPLDFENSANVTGSVGRDGQITIAFQGGRQMILQRRGTSGTFDATSSVGGSTQTGVIRISSLNNVPIDGSWTGTWNDSGQLTNLNWQMTRGNNYVQIRGTVSRGANAGRVVRGFGTIVGNRFEFFVEMRYDALMQTREVRGNGQIVNGRLVIGSNFSIQRQN